MFEITMPRARFHIYMAFYRAEEHQSSHMQTLWENRRFKKLQLNEIHAILGVEAYSNVRGPTKIPKSGPPLIKVNEARYAKAKESSAFTEKLLNRPKLLSKKPSPIKRKRSNSENDSDYDPTADASAGSEDTLEDIALERDTVVEQPKACKTSLYCICYLPMLMNYFFITGKSTLCTYITKWLTFHTNVSSCWKKFFLNNKSPMCIYLTKNFLFTYSHVTQNVYMVWCCGFSEDSTCHLLQESRDDSQRCC